MGDYSSATIKIYGVKGKEAEILKGCLKEFSTDGSEIPARPEEIEEGVELSIYEIGTGLCSDNKLSYLRDLGVSYSAWQDAGYDWPGECEMFTPELGLFNAAALKDTPALDAYEIDRLLSDNSLNEGELRLRLGMHSGKAHREAFRSLAGEGRAS